MSLLTEREQEIVGEYDAFSDAYDEREAQLKDLGVPEHQLFADYSGMTTNALWSVVRKLMSVIRRATAEGDSLMCTVAHEWYHAWSREYRKRVSGKDPR